MKKTRLELENEIIGLKNAIALRKHDRKTLSDQIRDKEKVIATAQKGIASTKSVIADTFKSDKSDERAIKQLGKKLAVAKKAEKDAERAAKAKARAAERKAKAKARAEQRKAAAKAKAEEKRLAREAAKAAKNAPPAPEPAAEERQTPAEYDLEEANGAGAVTGSELQPQS